MARDGGAEAAATAALGDGRDHVQSLYPRLPSLELPLEQGDWTFTGGLDTDGRPHGPGTLSFGSGTRYEGRFAHGLRIGRGTLWLPDHAHVNLTFGRDGRPSGDVMLTRPDGGYFQGQVDEHGALTGDVVERDKDADLRFSGFFERGRPSGRVEMTLPDGGRIVGEASHETGLLCGIAHYYYPDGSYLEGEWRDGIMFEARYELGPGGGDDLPADEHADALFCYDPAVEGRLSSDPLVEDPYEARRVMVGPSGVADGAGQGLFARRKAAKGELFAFYNGVRVSPSVVDARSWLANMNTMSLSDEVILDVPPESSSPDVYRATLGHKCNHSFEPNADYDNYWHPRFGHIIALRATRDIAEGEEFTIQYGYEMSGGRQVKPSDVRWDEVDVPEWFRALGRKWSAASSQASSASKT